ncbi:hypothetical protein Cgig2_010277 [Carnegiea gigantea]|uniref:Uncharacterized protein n=1 Tax=Carnegiea gigantea TaxID=171969 RepID=A0A9Q1JRA3_9CARY|nr:hypothetical protein Cgig2_010277 [Carnegiea gigantea]
MATASATRMGCIRQPEDTNDSSKKEEGLLSHWRKENAERKDGLKGQSSSNTREIYSRTLKHTNSMLLMRKESVSMVASMRRPVDKKIHNCKNFARLSTHEVIHASIVGGKIRAADFHDLNKPLSSKEGVIFLRKNTRSIFFLNIGRRHRTYLEDFLKAQDRIFDVVLFRQSTQG